MRALLLEFPLLLWLALTPLTLAVAAVLSAMGVTRQSPAARGLLVAAAVPMLAALGILLVYATLYLFSPGFSDHIEPNTAIVAWLYAQGGQIYHALDAPERYAFLYGPAPYIATAWVYKLLGPGVFPAKLAGYICLLLTLVFLTLAVRRRVPDRWLPCLAALGYFALLALFFRNHSFWSKPDPFMIAAAAAGALACVMNPGRAAWVVCGLALGIAVNAKVTGAVYFIPYLAWFYYRDGFRAPLVVSLVAAVLALLPFWSLEQISLPNYIGWLQSAGGHGLDQFLFLQNVAYLLFIASPVLLYMAWQAGSVGIRCWCMTHALVVAGAVSAALLILIAASKPGSGAHHFLPFLPGLALLVAVAVRSVHVYRPATTWSIYGFWAPLAAFLLAGCIKAGFVSYYSIGVVFAQQQAADVTADVAAIVRDNPGRNIYMGYGDGSRYVDTFPRAQLAFAGQPYLLDAAAMMDFQMSGLKIPAATINRIRSDDTAVWLIPAGQEPFMLVNWYYRRSGGLLFDEAFRSAFNTDFTYWKSTGYFDLYVRRDAPGLPGAAQGGTAR